MDSALVRGFVPHLEDLSRTLKTDPYGADLLMYAIVAAGAEGNAQYAAHYSNRLVALKPDFSRLSDLRRTQDEGKPSTD